MCIHEHLPPDSATVREEARVSNGISNMLLASVVDAIHELACGLAGNKLADGDRLTPLFADAIGEEKAAKAAMRIAKKQRVVDGLRARGK